MKFFDSHCHLHDSRVVDDVKGILVRAGQAGVKYMVSCATAEDNFKTTSDLAKFSAEKQLPKIIPCFGIHPWFIEQVSPDWKKNLEDALLSIPSGIGETGLDFMDKQADRDKQIKIFEHHLILARELERPINIHIRKAWDSLIHILKKTGPLKTPGLIHSYSGSKEMVPVFEKYNLFLSFSGSVTNPGSKKAISALQAVSKNRFVLETDSPDILPYFDKKRITGLNEPRNLPGIAEVAAHRLGVNLDEFSDQAFENSLVLFKPVLENVSG